MQHRFFPLIILICFLTAPQAAFAYLDAGTGSQILQIAIATFVGAAFGLKAGWHKIKALFRKVWKVKK